MTDRLGGRLKLGILIPAFNASVQPEMEAMRPPGITNHIARIDMPDRALDDDNDQITVIESLGDDLFGALRRVMHVRPGGVIFAMSIPCFWTGIAGGAALRAKLEDAAGVPVITADAACLDALRHLPRARRLGLLTPFQSVANDRLRTFFAEAGFPVAALRSTEAASNLQIAHADAALLADGFKALAAEGCDTILQLGTNLASADVAEEATRWLGLPCLSVNALLYRAALRACGVDAPVRGCEVLD